MQARLLIYIIAASLIGALSPVQAQQPAKIPRIGYVSGTGDAINQGPYVEALRQGLRELGYVEGKNITIEYRGAEGKLDRIPSIVQELVQLKVDILIAPVPSSNPRRHASDQDDPHCHGCRHGSSRNRAGR